LRAPALKPLQHQAPRDIATIDLVESMPDFRQGDASVAPWLLNG
jgi:hypothetical protein